MVSLNTFTPTHDVTPESMDALLADVMDYHPWDKEQIRDGGIVKDALTEALSAILCLVPPCADRSTAIRKLRECRMDCNSAITHKGKY